MGVVYRARDVRLNRRVALKMIRAGEHAGPTERERFRTEAEVVARLRHPNVVQIYEVGEHRGRPLLALEYVEGGNLKEKLRAAPLPPDEAARLLETLARAVHAAHAHHVVHRDLKPANVLLTADGAPKITDFGLAKKLDEVGQTQTGAVLGTPSYMAPEQAGYQSDGQARGVGPLVDVHALGAILYECLTGRPPFLAATTHDTLRLVIGEEPVPPRRLLPACPRDLETICLKCLRKEPQRRYPGAEALADDLGRFLWREPVTARPVGRAERLGSWCRRHPARALVGALLVGVVLLTVLGGGAHWRWRDAERQRRRAEQARDDLTAEQQLTADALAAAESAGQEEQRQRRRAEAGEALADRLLYFSDVQLAQRAWEAGDVEGMREIVDGLGKHRPGQEDLPGFEWRYLDKRCPLRRTLKGHLLGALGVSWGADGRRVASCAFDGTVRIWDTNTGKELSILKHSVWVGHARWASDGRRLAVACADGKAHIWDADAGKELAALEGIAGPIKPGWLIGREVNDVAWSPDGKRLASASVDCLAHVWDVAAGKEAMTLRGHTGALKGIARDREGKRLATSAEDGTVRLWDPDTGKEQLQLRGHRGNVADLKWCPDGKLVAAACSDGTVRVWDADSGKEARAPLRGHTDAVRAADWSPDGKRLASASADRTVRVWDAEGGAELLTLTGHTARVQDVSWSPDGRRLVSASMDQTIRVWEVGDYEPDRVLTGHTDRVLSVGWSPDGRHIAAGSGDRRVLVWEADTGRETRDWKPAGYSVGGLSWSPGGDRLAFAGDDGKAHLWDVETGKEVRQLPLNTTGLSVRWAPDGRRVAVAVYGPPVVHLWDAQTGQITRTLTWAAVAGLGSAPPGITGVSWSPDGRRLATAANDFALHVWDGDTGQELLSFKGPSSFVTALAWSPDGLRVAGSCWDHTIRIWDAGAGKEALVLKGHTARVNDVRWSPDGTRLASASFDKTARVWDAQTGKEALTLKGHTNEVTGVCWSPDGQRLHG